MLDWAEMAQNGGFAGIMRVSEGKNMVLAILQGNSVWKAGIKASACTLK